ncbi:MAG: 4-(cytidine 5'-diphospho)-2-C-methyl-D-erythritol kinase, partial [Desulfobacterales bacterium]|nr:4-(cytidine 5'-diphospho)-2-C-methyl-D-erythritol kinase [Desulfobacterales bacterium]
PAKINLLLKVVGKRANGYHEVITLISRINLFDTVALAFDQPSITVHCSHPKVPQGRNNLACQAASLFFEALSRREGVAILIEKVIPVAAGLGGGSSNAASVLMGLNHHCGFPFSNSGLMDMGLKVGADVPFFLLRHTAVARGIGEQLKAFEGIPELSAVLVCPRFEVSTAWVYKNLNLRLTNCEENFKVSEFKKDLSNVKDLLCNDLEQVTLEKFPEINTIKKVLLDLGAQGALMSGSGPSVFGLFQTPQQASLAFQTIRHQQRWDAFLVKLLAP